MNITLRPEVIEKLSERGILAYVAVKLNKGKWATPAKLAELIRVPENVMADGLKSLSAVQNLDSLPKKKRQVEASPVSLPEWIDRRAWDSYVEMRQRIGKPLVDAARALAIGKLVKLMKDGNDPTEVLQQSVFNSWQGLFPLRRDFVSNGHQPTAVKLKETEFKL